MKALLQRVSSASVTIEGRISGQIGPGLLVFLGVEKGDGESQAERLAERVLGYRVFSDEEGKMNLSVSDIRGGLLVVSQFTLVADTKKGTRPGFSKGAGPEHGKAMYNYFVEILRKHQPVETGRFGADMKVALVNDGPVTFLLETTA